MTQNPSISAARRMASYGAWLVAAALLGVAVWPSPEVQAARPTTITLAGLVLEDQSTEPLALARMFASRWLAESVTVRVGDKTLTRSRAALGATLDVDHLARLIRDARDAHSVLRTFHSTHGNAQSLALPIPMRIDVARAERWLMPLADSILRTPEEPKLDLATGAIKDERVGISLDLNASLQALEAGLQQLAPSIQLRVIEDRPTHTKQELAGAQFHALLGEFETRYTGGVNMQDRIANLRAAASRVDGLILRPGEEFDFNARVGERSQANGFRDAPVIANGLLSEDVGGGTCQISGTLHAAAFFSGVPILERHPHSRPSYYIKMGLDAMVSYPSRNFRFRNDFPFPIAINVRVANGTVRAELHGATREREVTFVRRIDQVLPFEERDSRDAALPSSMRILRQRGVPGFKLTRFRVVRDTHTNISRRERWEDTYPATSQVWRQGTASSVPAGFVAPAGDEHLEYVADELLLATEGPSIEGLRETRHPGRTGEYGWTVREGMARGAAR